MGEACQMRSYAICCITDYTDLKAGNLVCCLALAPQEEGMIAPGGLIRPKQVQN